MFFFVFNLATVFVINETVPDPMVAQLCAVSTLATPIMRT